MPHCSENTRTSIVEGLEVYDLKYVMWKLPLGLGLLLVVCLFQKYSSILFLLVENPYLAAILYVVIDSLYPH